MAQCLPLHQLIIRVAAAAPFNIRSFEQWCARNESRLVKEFNSHADQQRGRYDLIDPLWFHERFEDEVGLIPNKTIPTVRASLEKPR